MKDKVRFSIYSWVVTAAVLIIFAVMIILLFLDHEDHEKKVLITVMFALVILSGLYYCPTSVEATQNRITLHRLLARSKSFDYSDIQAVDTCYPSAGGLRLCGSGGFFGYWGYFSDIMIGTYFGYYGSRDSCFLIRLKNSRQYVIGCENPVAMVGYIQSQMDKSDR
ncbi:MAG: PH domain-containing protein [Muribaculaceae bacterium]|nr:PH domain-containing protein [Muribaculaceae bacterium]